MPDLPTAAAGPPYPAPIAGVSVYDYAGALAPSTRQRAASTIAGIEDRTGAEVIGTMSHPAISGHGRNVAFDSGAADLVPGDVNQKPDVFLRDLGPRS